MDTAISVMEVSTLLSTMIHKVWCWLVFWSRIYRLVDSPLSSLLTTGHFRFVSLQSKVGQSLLIRSGRQPDDLSSIVLCEKDGQAYVESDAILKIAQGLSAPLNVAGKVGFVVPSAIRDALYHVVAENRYRFGETDGPQCRMDYDGEFDNRFIPDP